MFSVTVLHDDRIVLVAEQRPDASEEDSFQWMSRVLQVGAGTRLLPPVCRCVVQASPCVLAFPISFLHSRRWGLLLLDVRNAFTFL